MARTDLQPGPATDHYHTSLGVDATQGDYVTVEELEDALSGLELPAPVINNFVTEIATNETFVTQLVSNVTYVSEFITEITEGDEADTYITQVTENNTFVTNVTNQINANISGKKGVASELASLNASGDIPAAQIPEVLKTRTIQFVIDGGGAAITAGIKGDIEVPWAGTITAWRVFADASGSITVGIWKDSYANFPPVVGDLLVSPALSSASKAEATGLSHALAAGDILRFNANATPATVTRVTVSLTVLVTVPA